MLAKPCGDLCAGREGGAGDYVVGQGLGFHYPNHRPRVKRKPERCVYHRLLDRRRQPAQPLGRGHGHQKAGRHAPDHTSRVRLLRRSPMGKSVFRGRLIGLRASN